ncbi:MAG TPA: carboxypeptidase regulatory-like domain-containing protein [Vicinamibacterales bacterium]|nr:carboxypeptidase regulatory-like domain-containing protein [Vicinamibacterales bacterium]
MGGRVFGAAWVAMLMWACSLVPASAQGVGAIGGTIGDASGAVLPGVTVTLSSPAGTIGANQTAVTDERGAFQFIRLVPGTYRVRAEIQGFRPATQENIPVTADATARVDLHLEIGGLEEGIVVTGESPLLDTTSAMRQTVLTREVLDSLPNRVDVWAAARVIPSVVLGKLDVGGSESFLQSTATVHGTSTENAYLIEGMDVSNLDGNGSAAIMYLDPYVFEETNYQMGSAGTAVSSKGGLIFNMITRTGTNRFHGGVMFNGANRSMGSANYSPELRTQLLAAVPSAALAANPNIVPGADILKIYDGGAWLAGPIVQDRLWFSAAWHRQALDQYLLGNYDPNGSQVLDDNLMWTTSEKVSWQAAKNVQLSYFNNLQYKLIGHRNGGGTFAESRARNLNDKYPDIHQAKYTQTVGNRLVLDASYNRFRADDKFGQEPEVKAGDISRFDAVTNTYTIALPTYRDLATFRDQVMGSVGYFTGRHDIRFGYQFMTAVQKSSIWSTSGMRAVYRNGRPDSVNTYNVPITSTSTRIPVAYEPSYRDQGLYVQDKWTPARRLTVNVGLRWESNYGWQPASCQVQTTFVNQQCFGEISGAPDFKALAPRASVVYDIFGDGRTALKFAASRYDQPITLQNVLRLNPLGATSDTRVWTVCAAGQTTGCDLNGDLTPQVNELGVSSGFAFGVNNRYDEGLKWPVSNEYSLEFQRQIPGNMVVSVGYTHRETRRNIGSRNVAVPTDSYIPLVVTEANSGRQVTVYNQAPGLRGRNDILWDNYEELNSDFNGADFSVNKRLSHHWSVTGGASFGKTEGDTAGVASDLNNPNFLNRRGLVGNDVPWSYRASGVYEFPYQLSVSLTAQYYQGFPESTTVSVGNNTVTLTQGATTLQVEPRGTTRLPAVSSVDMSIRKFWRLAGLKLEPRVDFYNLTNAASILGRVTQLGPTYGRVSNIQRGRLVKAGFSVEF